MRFLRLEAESISLKLFYELSILMTIYFPSTRDEGETGNELPRRKVSNGINFFAPGGGELIPCPPFGGLNQFTNVKT